MPIYEYQCKACGREFEYQQRMSDPEKTDCEACGKATLERLISRTAFQLKGGGWYKDLYASSQAGGEARARRSADGGAATPSPRARRARARAASSSSSSTSAAVRAAARVAAAASGSATSRRRASSGGGSASSGGGEGRGERVVTAAHRRQGGRGEAARRGRRRPRPRCAREDIAPTLAVVLVGDDPASAVYVRSKTKAAREAGVDVRDHKLPATTTQAELHRARRSRSTPIRSSTASSCRCRCRRSSTATR